MTRRNTTLTYCHADSLTGSGLGVTQLLHHDDTARLAELQQIASELKAPLIACGSVEMHSASRKMLHDVVTAIRHNSSVQELGKRRSSNSQQHLRRLDKLLPLYPTELIGETLRLAQQCHFSLDELRYEYPEEVVPNGHSANSYLRECVSEGANKRWPNGVPSDIHKRIEHELELITELNYEYYFLTVYDVVNFARRRGILCQGRGSAANSVVCYCLHITEVSPEHVSLLFERFISRERDEPPDIDVDFEHERREEVIQYIYEKYTRRRAALAATVLSLIHI